MEEKLKIELGAEQKIKYSKHLIKVLLPFLEKISKEQESERELEAKIRGISFLSLFLP